MDDGTLGDADKTVIKHDTPEAIQQQSSSHDNSEENDKPDSSKNTSVNAKTENTEVSELETNGRIINDFPQIDNNEPILNADENLSNDNHPISEDLHNEGSSIRTNDELGEQNFPTGLEQHRIPQFRMNQEARQIIIDPDANNAYGINYHLNEIELSRFVNTHTLYSIIEENPDEQSAEDHFHQNRSFRNRIRTFPRRNRATETQFVINVHINSYNDENLNRMLRQNQNSFNPRRRNRNFLLTSSLFRNHSSTQQLFINLGAGLINNYNLVHALVNEQQHNLVQLRNEEMPNNFGLQQNHVYNEISETFHLPATFIYLSERHAYHNVIFNTLFNENLSMEELDLENLRLNYINNQNNMLEPINTEASNILNNIAEINLIANNEVPPNNLLTVQENLPQLRNQENQLQQRPFHQEILIANGGINPMNGGHNALIQLIRNNPNLLYLNIRNLILIFHPEILEEENDLLFDPNRQLSPAWELLRENNAAQNNRSRNNQNINQEFNSEAGPSNESNKHFKERNP